MRAEGASLQEIGDHFGVSRERVRQVVNEFSDVIKRRREVQDAAETEAMLKEFLELLAVSPGISREEVEQHLGEPWRKIFTAMPVRWAKFLKEEGRPLGLKWSQDQILEAIRRAARVEEPLSQKTFDLLVREGVIDCCSTVRIAQIFDKWSIACDLAGVRSVGSFVGEYQRSWSESDCIDWVCRFLLSSETSRSVDAYGLWVKEQEGNPPSSGTIRTTVGPWSTSITEALGELTSEKYSEVYQASLKSDLAAVQAKISTE